MIYSFFVAYFLGIIAPGALVARALHTRSITGRRLARLAVFLETPDRPATPSADRNRALLDEFREFLSFVVSLAMLGFVAGVGFLYALSPIDSLLLPNTNVFILSATFEAPKAGGVEHQLSSLTAIVAAFLGAYVMTLFRMFRQTEAQQLSPSSIIGGAGRIVAAGMVTLAGWHAVSAIYQRDVVAADRTSLFVTSFLAGFIVAAISPYRIARFLHQVLQRLPLSRLPTSDAATELGLIEGLERNTRDRLSLLGIQNIQGLGTANPLRLLGPASTDLVQIADWVAQAQLAMAVGVQALASLRSNGVRTIFETAAPGNYIEGIVEQIRGTPQFARLERVVAVAKKPEVDTILLASNPAPIASKLPSAEMAQTRPDRSGGIVSRYPIILLEGKIAAGQQFYFMVDLRAEIPLPEAEDDTGVHLTSEDDAKDVSEDTWPDADPDASAETWTELAVVVQLHCPLPIVLYPNKGVVLLQRGRDFNALSHCRVNSGRCRAASLG